MEQRKKINHTRNISVSSNNIKTSRGNKTSVNKKVETRKEKTSKKAKSGIFYIARDFDKPYFILVITLLTIGMVAMFSASYSEGLSDFNDGLYFLKRQGGFAVIGIAAMIVISFVNYNFLDKAKIAFGVFIPTFFLLAFTSFFGVSHNDSRRWIEIAGLEFQPSEIMKFALILLFSYMISNRYEKMKDFKYGIIPFGIILGAVAGVLMLQPHLSATILMIAIGVVLMFVGGTRITHIVAIGIIGLVGLALVVAFLYFVQGYDYFGARMQSWQNPFSDMQGDTWQTAQSLIAIGSGGLFGMGFGNSRQKFLYLPESQNDFVFAIWCEEMGFIGAALVILLFILLIFRGFYLASIAKNKFGMLLIIGVTVQIGLQALLNIAVVTNSIPNTGISLPFFSYGGTALVMQLASAGVVLSVSRQVVEDE